MAHEQGGFAGTRQGTDAPSRAMQSQGDTGVPDPTYNLISVVYHALQGAETYRMYEQDVQGGEHAELAQFFRQAREEEQRRAQQGRELLAKVLGKPGTLAAGKQQLQSGGSSQQRS